MEIKEIEKKEMSDKTKYEPLNIRAEKVLGLTIKDFIKENTSHTQIEFFERYTPVIMMAMDRKKYLELLEKNMKDQHKDIDNKLKVILKLTEVMDFYNEQSNAFITSEGDKISTENLIKYGYAIESNKLKINK